MDIFQILFTNLLIKLWNLTNFIKLDTNSNFKLLISQRQDENFI